MVIEEVAVANLQILTTISTVETEENHVKFHGTKLMPQPKPEERTSPTKSEKLWHFS
jgi:hypothetical protein